MRIHHLNCNSMCPLGGRLMDGRHGARGPAVLVCHCLLVEANDGLVLVDTGFGLQDVRQPEERLSRFFLNLCRPQLREENTAVRQIEALGFRAADVRHIVLTHLDFDHAGGLDDFPNARIHLLGSEYEVASRGRTALDRARFRPAQWHHPENFVLYPSERGESWFGFQAVRQLEGLPPEVLFIPLFGHTAGHAGVAIHTGSRWLLHAGDAYFYRGELDPRGYRCTPGLRAYQTMMEQDRDARQENQQRLRNLVRRHGGSVTVFSAHDAIEFQELARTNPPLRDGIAIAERGNP